MGTLPWVNKWKKNFIFFCRLDHDKFHQNCRIGQKVGFVCLPNMGCWNSKLVSPGLDAGNSKKGIRVTCYHLAEKK